MAERGVFKVLRLQRDRERGLLWILHSDARNCLPRELARYTFY